MGHDLIFVSIKPAAGHSSSKLLHPLSVLTVASLDICSHLHWLPRSLAINNNNATIAATFSAPRGEALIVASNGSDADANITLSYADLGISFQMKGIFLSPASISFISRKLGHTLALFQYCRDHIDSLIYLPFEMRENRIKESAADFEVDVDTFRFVAKNIGAMLRLIS
jgi:hypothetical protein